MYIRSLICPHATKGITERSDMPAKAQNTDDRKIYAKRTRMRVGGGGVTS